MLETLSKESTAVSRRRNELFSRLADEIRKIDEAHGEEFSKFLLECHRPGKAYIDLFWDFFTSGISDHFIPRSDDYDYSRYFAHTPFWIALLANRFNIKPPCIDVSYCE